MAADAIHIELFVFVDERLVSVGVGGFFPKGVGGCMASAASVGTCEEIAILVEGDGFDLFHGFKIGLLYGFFVILHPFGGEGEIGDLTREGEEVVEEGAALGREFWGGVLFGAYGGDLGDAALCLLFVDGSDGSEVFALFAHLFGLCAVALDLFFKLADGEEAALRCFDGFPTAFGCIGSEVEGERSDLLAFFVANEQERAPCLARGRRLDAFAFFAVDGDIDPFDFGEQAFCLGASKRRKQDDQGCAFFL